MGAHQLKFRLSTMVTGGNVPTVAAQMLFLLPQTGVSSGPTVTKLLRDGRDAAGSLHDETHLHVREAVLFSLGAPLVRRGHVQVEAQRHGLLPQLGIPPEEGALPLLYHLINLLCPGERRWRCW